MKVPYKTVKDKGEAFARIKSYITPSLFSKYNINPKIEYLPGNDQIVALGKGFELKIIFADSDLLLDLNVGIFLRAFKQVILEKIEKEVRGLV
ncbi:MAG: hypothetical protein HYV97_07915 [Bdellovibrio sp.]|nr:hypothetical protein [Bdellovibrio sp.]